MARSTTWPDRPTRRRRRTHDADADPAPVPRRPRRSRPDEPAPARPTSCRVTSRSSWTATGAGPACATCPSSTATPPASRRSATLLTHAVRRGVPVLTLYAFSRENWARSDDEVTGLFGLLEAAIRSETDELRAQGVRVRLLGRLDELPDATRASIGEALDATAGGERLLLNIAFNYAGRTELVDAVRRLAASGDRRPRRSTRRAISAALYTAGLPDPDLVIRTGGEQRLSNFLIWQSAYAEFYTCDTLWPDFGPDAFDAALLEFARRQRRFGR